jgi:hypothetical protein
LPKPGDHLLRLAGAEPQAGLSKKASRKTHRLLKYNIFLVDIRPFYKTLIPNSIESVFWIYIVHLTCNIFMTIFWQLINQFNKKCYSLKLI